MTYFSFSRYVSHLYETVSDRHAVQLLVYVKIIAIKH